MAVNRTDLARGIDHKKMAPISYHTANVLRCVLQRLRMETEVVDVVKQLGRQADGTTLLFLKVCK